MVVSLTNLVSKMCYFICRIGTEQSIEGTVVLPHPTEGILIVTLKTLCKYIIVIKDKQLDNLVLNKYRLTRSTHLHASRANPSCRPEASPPYPPALPIFLSPSIFIFLKVSRRELFMLTLSQSLIFHYGSACGLSSPPILPIPK